MNNIEDQIECIKKFKHFADLVESPEEYFQHMQGHYKELSLIIRVFDIAAISDKLIEALEQQLNNGWIPVSERLPDIEDTILCQCKNNYNEIFVGKYRDADKWKNKPYFDWKQNGFPDVLAWQPLPEKYINK